MFICNIILLLLYYYNIMYMTYILCAMIAYQMYKHSSTYTGSISMSSILTIYMYGKNMKEKCGKI